MGAVACSATAGLKPVRDEDPQSACPAGRVAWNLQILDQRARLADSERIVALVRNSLSTSFPGCRWGGDAGSGTITIEIHRFAASLDGGIWDAAADWTVSVRDAEGRTLTTFDSTFEDSRPNYRNVDNEKALLQQVLEEAVRRTAKGLRALSSTS